MVLGALSAGTRIAQVVARATPAGFKVLDAACAALESDALAGVRAQAAAAEAIPGRQEFLAEGPATAALVGFRAACEVRKALRRKR